MGGYRGNRKHLKRLNAPKHWMLDKLGGIWAPRPSTGPHKLRECIPLILLLRNRLKYALDRREVLLIVMQRLIKVDGKVRTDTNYPAGFMDVISIDKTGENFRMLYDTKGRFALHKIKGDEPTYKLCKVTQVSKAKKNAIGSNPLQSGQAGAVPYIVTHDGRTIRYPDPHIKKADTVKIDLATGKVLDHIAFDLGKLAMVTKGANIGRIGLVSHRDRHPGSFDIIHVTDRSGVSFATRADNVFIIGESQKEPWVSLPRGKGVKLSVIDDTERKMQK